MSDANKKGRGRPKWEPDIEVVTKLYSNMATDQDVADWFNVNIKTIERHNKNNPEFTQAKTKGLANARMSLRMEQFKSAKAGNSTMLVWLGKQYLGQTDKVEQVINVGEIPSLDDYYDD